MSNILPKTTTVSQPTLFDNAADEQFAALYQYQFNQPLTAETIRDVRAIHGLSSTDYVTIWHMDHALTNVSDRICRAQSNGESWKIDVFLKYIPAQVRETVLAEANNYAVACANIHDLLHSEDRRLANQWSELRNAALDRAHRAVSDYYHFGKGAK